MKHMAVYKLNINMNFVSKYTAQPVACIES